MPGHEGSPLDEPTTAPDGSALMAAYRAIRGEGTAADGRVRIVLDGSSDLVELDLDPYAMRAAARYVSPRG